MPRGRERYPGEERLVGICFEINPSRDPYWVRDYATWQREAFADTRTLEIDLDAVLFADGALYGEDTKRPADDATLAQNFTAFFMAKQQFTKKL
jgi:hypothetical protein